MKSRHNITIIIALIILSTFFISGCSQNNTSRQNSKTQTSDNKQVDHLENKVYTFVQIITYSGESSTTIIKKNKLTKTASVEIYNFYDKNELWNANSNTKISCTQIAKAFYSGEESKEFNDELEQLNSQSMNVEDDSPPEKLDEVIGSNPLEGYTLSSIETYFKDRSSGNTLSKCTISGSSESDIVVKIN